MRLHCSLIFLFSFTYEIYIQPEDISLNMPTSDQDTRELFRAHGLRITLLRLQIYRAIIRLPEKEFCAQDLCQILNTQEIYLNPASISRVIKQFEEVGLISKNTVKPFNFFNKASRLHPMAVGSRQAR
jgi:Fe2+ or Zn2+ uptake regulation protein